MLYSKFTSVDRPLQLSQTFQTNVTKEHTRHDMLYEINKRNSATAAMNDIFEMCEQVISVN